MDRGTWQATVHDVAKSWTLLSNQAHSTRGPEKVEGGGSQLLGLSEEVPGTESQFLQ